MRWTQNLLQGEWEEAGAESSGAHTYVLLRKGTTLLFHLPPENSHSQHLHIERVFLGWTLQVTNSHCSVCSANYVPIRGVNDKFQTARAEWPWIPWSFTPNLPIVQRVPISHVVICVVFFLMSMIRCENCAEAHLSKGIDTLQLQVCFVHLQSFLGAGSLS